MNLNPEKLHNSKWTAANPKNKEKHFMVIQVYRDMQNRVTDVDLEAVLTKRVRKIPWRALKDEALWHPGWQ